jgi:hypothetical protein
VKRLSDSMEKIMIGRIQKLTLLRCTKVVEGSVLDGVYVLSTCLKYFYWCECCLISRF